MNRHRVIVAAALASLLTGCPEFWSALSASGPIVAAAGQVAGSYADAIAKAKAAGQLPSSDPRVDQLEQRIAKLEADEADERAACVDAGTPLDARALVDRLDVAARERAAIAAELRSLLAAPLPAPAVLPLVDAGAEGGT